MALIQPDMLNGGITIYNMYFIEDILYHILYILETEIEHSRKRSCSHSN